MGLFRNLQKSFAYFLTPSQFVGWIDAVSDALDGGVGGLSFDTIRKSGTQLLAVDSATLASLTSGAVASVTSLKTEFYWDPTSVLADDPIGNTVVKPTVITGAGRFLRSTAGRQVFWSQATWHVDPIGGNNENDGLTLGTSLLDELEIDRRWGRPAYITGIVNIFVHGNLTDWQMHFIGSKDAIVYVHGDRRVQYTNATGGLTAKTDINPATNTRPTITDAAAPWTANANIGLVRSLVLNKVAFIAADLGAGVARISNPIIEPANLTTGAISPTVTTFAVNDTFQIETYYQILRGNVEFSVSAPSPNSTVPCLIFENLVLGGDVVADLSQSFLVWSMNRTTSAVFADCVLSALTTQRAKCRINNCLQIKSGFGIQEGTPLISAGLLSSLMTGAPQASIGHIMYQLNTISEMNFRLTVSSVINIGNVPNSMAINGLGLFPTGVAIDAVGVSYNSRLFVGSNATPLWGTAAGAGAVGIRVDSGGYAQYAVKPTVTGAAGDTVVGGTAKAYAAIPYVEATNLAALVAAA